MTKRDQALQDIMLVATVALAMGAYMVMNTATLGDGDTAWHVAAGRWIVEHGNVPTTDPFSFTARGRAWTAHEWLSEVLMYGAYHASGWTGVLILYASCVAATFAVLAIHLRRWMAPAVALIPLLYCAVGFQPSLLARPHVIGWVFLAIWLTALVRAVDERRRPSLWLVLLIAAWANAHASSIFGFLLIAPFALDALLNAKADERKRTFIGWSIFALLCLVAITATPSGIQGVLYPFQVAGMTSLKFIKEWHPTTFGRFGTFEVVLLSGLFFCLYKPVQVPLARLFVLLGMLHMALSQERHQSIFFLASVVILAEPLARAYSGRVEPRFNLKSELRANLREFAPVLAVIIALFGGVAALALVQQKTRQDSYGVPGTAIAAVPASLRDKPVLNEYSFGGSLILAGVPVFIDGRNDMYGDAHTEDYVAIVNDGDRARWEAAQKKWGLVWTIMPLDRPLTKMLDADPRWRRIYADQWAVIHVSRERTAGLDLTLSAHPAAIGQVHPVGQEQVRKP